MGKFLVFFSIFMLVSCTNVYKQVSPSIKLKTEEALNKVSLDRKKVLIEAITELPVDQQEGMAYLIAYMRPSDLDTLPAELLISNVKMAYKAR